MAWLAVVMVRYLLKIQPSLPGLKAEGTPRLAVEFQASARAAEGEVDPLCAQLWMMPLVERQHAVIAQAVHAAPDHDVPVKQWHSPAFVTAFQTTEQKDRR
ncbi:hypothetical protein D3C78_1383280 [compost metagenome]